MKNFIWYNSRSFHSLSHSSSYVKQTGNYLTLRGSLAYDSIAYHRQGHNRRACHTMAVVPLQLPWFAMMKGGLTEYFFLTTKTFISIKKCNKLLTTTMYAPLEPSSKAVCWNITAVLDFRLRKAQSVLEACVMFWLVENIFNVHLVLLQWKWWTTLCSDWNAQYKIFW